MVRILFILFLLPFSALAQSSPSSQRMGEITTKPLCGVLVNRSDQTIMGTISTAGQTVSSGDVVRHQDNFKLKSGDRKDFCANGPFFEGKRLEITLRTIVPLFTCKTQIDKEIYMDAKLDENGINRLSATCY